MALDPVFAVLSAPLCKKNLQRFRRDAGWSLDDADARRVAARPTLGQVRWASLEYQRQLVGIVRLELAAPHFCCLSELIIASQHRRKGLGAYFVKQIEQYCAQAGIGRLLLQPVEQARGFYDALHFIPDPMAAGFLKKEVSAFGKKRWLS